MGAFNHQPVPVGPVIGPVIGTLPAAEVRLLSPHSASGQLP